MLMKTKTVDFHHVEEHHQAIDARLSNWGLWLQSRPGGKIHPMWAKARSNAWQWHAPEHRPTCDPLDAQAMEKAVYKLPEKHRAAIRWQYVYRGSPARACRALAVNMDGLAELVRQGRTMLVNLGV